MLRCAWCRNPLQDVHGHGACLTGGCPMFGQNQAECCSGETADDGWVPTSDLASAAGDTDEPPPVPVCERPPAEPESGEGA